MQRLALPRLPFLRLLVPRTSKPTLLPVNRGPQIRLTPSVSRGFRSYPPLRQQQPLADAPGTPELPENASATAKLKYLIKSYGWYALGVYAVLTVVDFSIAFAGINFIGAEHVSKVTTRVKGVIEGMWHGSSPEDSPDGVVNGRESVNGGGREGLYAMLILAYTVHKTLFLPFRVGLTVAITPKFVRWLRSRGWTGSGGATRAATHLRGKMKRKTDRD